MISGFTPEGQRVWEQSESSEQPPQKHAPDKADERRPGALINHSVVHGLIWSGEHSLDGVLFAQEGWMISPLGRPSPSISAAAVHVSIQGRREHYA
jgi:hypothetical protein